MGMNSWVLTVDIKFHVQAVTYKFKIFIFKTKLNCIRWNGQKAKLDLHVTNRAKQSKMYVSNEGIEITR